MAFPYGAASPPALWVGVEPRWLWLVKMETPFHMRYGSAGACLASPCGFQGPLFSLSLPAVWEPVSWQQ